jgi:hypothetical protein
MAWEEMDTIEITGDGKDQWRGLTPGVAAGAQQIAVTVETGVDLPMTINACGFAALVYPDGSDLVTLRSRRIPFLPPRNANNRYLLQVPPQMVPSHLPEQLPIVIISIPRWFPDTTVTYWVYRL